jgi:hypothetical protein
MLRRKPRAAARSKRRASLVSKKWIVRADLDRAVAGVGDFERERREVEVGGERAVGGHDDFAGDHGQRMGLWTVTSLVPSGKVASTCTSWIISATPSITSATFQDRGAVAHEFGDGAAVAGAFDDLVGDDGDGLGVVELHAARLAAAGEVGGGDDEEFFAFAGSANA